MSDIHSAAQSGFTQAAPSYIHGRPGYPPEILNWPQSQIGLAPGKRALELGAGTGKFTQFLARTGAQVAVIEPVAAMRAHLLENVPSACVAAGTAESIGVDDRTVDAVLCAQSFHWFATRSVLAEIARVLKPGGQLGLVWNLPDERIAWVAALEAIIKPYEETSPALYRRGTWRAVFPDEHFVDLECVEYQHAYTGSPQQVIIERVRSLSYIANLPPDEQFAVMERITALVTTRSELRGRSQIDFPYRTFAYHCQVAGAP